MHRMDERWGEIGIKNPNNKRRQKRGREEEPREEQKGLTMLTYIHPSQKTIVVPYISRVDVQVDVEDVDIEGVEFEDNERTEQSCRSIDICEDRKRKERMNQYNRSSISLQSQNRPSGDRRKRKTRKRKWKTDRVGNTGKKTKTRQSKDSPKSETPLKAHTTRTCTTFSPVVARRWRPAIREWEEGRDFARGEDTEFAIQPASQNGIKRGSRKV
ncbi:hypothetical protein CC1G_14731 [Coprinopsis cinerea okayama7|uniref:Uncharacterized protein n=1 Tax=Coprinopsis cinerea (strain Okayama-7 / 130 / ATCC MYA-4618 / FGSC 9003) TaxID=240176 RepID=D6RMM2_COPC7|nr:hypothetical protein CC1G_14731 [Coprinopsis cinerea okayama7\|eukprot:XP_002911302.1 hypothetical protein CC1G_14731 [Coprinopsis cinerea okayama7\